MCQHVSDLVKAVAQPRRPGDAEHDEDAAWSQDASDLSERGHLVDVVQDHRHRHGVEGGVREGQRLPRCGRVSDSSVVGREELLVRVDPHDASARLLEEPAQRSVATADVEHAHRRAWDMLLQQREVVGVVVPLTRERVVG
jgi:hypothetical protein